MNNEFKNKGKEKLTNCVLIVLLVLENKTAHFNTINTQFVNFSLPLFLN